MAEGNFVYLTRERIVEIEKELKEMKTSGRKDMLKKLRRPVHMVIFQKMQNTMPPKKNRDCLS